MVTLGLPLQVEDGDGLIVAATDIDALPLTEVVASALVEGEDVGVADVDAEDDASGLGVAESVADATLGCKRVNSSSKHIHGGRQAKRALRRKPKAAETMSTAFTCTLRIAASENAFFKVRIKLA